jgi:polyisoprenoid-binding protein YceI
VGEGSEARYLVREQLAGVSFPNDAIGKTKAVKGAIVLGPDGAVLAEQSKFTVDLSTLTSDRDQRDNYIKRNTLDTARYPLAEFVPREFTGLPHPLPTEGKASFQMKGDMTVHGVTSPLTWEVNATFSGGSITGQATASFDFAKFSMTRPRVQIVLSVEDEIRLQVDFVLKRAE